MSNPPPYTPLPPQDTAPPSYYPGDHPPPPQFQQRYAPAPRPPVLQQQTTNTVVVAQAAPSQMLITVTPGGAADNLILTVVMMVVCGMLANLPAFLFLAPALVFSIMATNSNIRGNYSEAKQRGRVSLYLNIAAIVSYIVLMILGIVIAVLVVSIPRHTIG